MPLALAKQPDLDACGAVRALSRNHDLQAARAQVKAALVTANAGKLEKQLTSILANYPAGT